MNECVADSCDRILGQCTLNGLRVVTFDFLSFYLKKVVRRVAEIYSKIF